jgi:hypothetical protein
VIPNPYVVIRDTAMRQMMDLGRLLDLTPGAVLGRLRADGAGEVRRQQPTCRRPPETPKPPKWTEAKRLQTNTVPATPENQIPPNSPERRSLPPRKEPYFTFEQLGAARIKRAAIDRGLRTPDTWDDLVLIAPERDDANEQPPRDAGHPKRAQLHRSEAQEPPRKEQSFAFGRHFRLSAAMIAKVLGYARTDRYKDLAPMAPEKDDDGQSPTGDAGDPKLT